MRRRGAPFAAVAAGALPLPQVHDLFRGRFLLVVLLVVPWPMSTVSGAAKVRWRLFSVAERLFATPIMTDCVNNMSKSTFSPFIIQAINRFGVVLLHETNADAA